MKFSMEDALTPQYIDKIYKDAEALVEKSRFKEADFAGDYGREMVERDMVSVYNEEKKHGPPNDDKKLATVFESIVFSHGENSNWLGDNAFTYFASKFDDYFNFVDTIVEFRSDTPGGAASYLGLGIDVTFSSDTTEKFDGIRRNIEKGKLSGIKYFHSDHTGANIQLKRVPQVIVGAERQTVEELAVLNHGGNKNKQEMQNHRIQIMILHQIKAQLKVYAKYARSLDPEDRSGIAVQCESRLAVIEQVLSTKADLEREVAYDIMTDRLHSEIMSFLASWDKSIEQV